MSTKQTIASEPYSLKFNVPVQMFREHTKKSSLYNFAVYETFCGTEKCPENTFRTGSDVLSLVFCARFS